MAHYSILYALDDVTAPLPTGEVALWRYDIPVSFLILIGADPRPCRSTCWPEPLDLCVTGPANEGRRVLRAFLDWTARQLDSADFQSRAGATIAGLEQDAFRRERYLLELCQLHEMGGDPPEAMERWTRSIAAQAADVHADARRVTEQRDTTIDDLTHRDLIASVRHWESALGLFEAFDP